jgi:hypothetical protein
MVNENYFNVTVVNGSTKFFGRTKILIEKISVTRYSEREEARVSSGEDVTATRTMQRIKIVEREGSLALLDLHAYRWDDSAD